MRRGHDDDGFGNGWWEVFRIGGGLIRVGVSARVTGLGLGYLNDEYSNLCAGLLTGISCQK